MPPTDRTTLRVQRRLPTWPSVDEALAEQRRRLLDEIAGRRSAQPRRDERPAAD